MNLFIILFIRFLIFYILHFLRYFQTCHEDLTSLDTKEQQKLFERMSESPVFLMRLVRQGMERYRLVLPIASSILPVQLSFKFQILKNHL